MKYLIVVDIPDDLTLSDLALSGGLWEIYKEDGWEYEFHEDDIKPMPQKKKPENPDESWEEMHERWGYNKCIEEIENG